MPPLPHQPRGGDVTDEEIARVMDAWVEWDLMERLRWGPLSFKNAPYIDVVDSEEWRG